MPYVDHPSFGVAIISRLLAQEGYAVGIIPQPNWRHTADFQCLGRPRLAVLISAGNMDSMVNRYTAARRLRHNDAYSPGGQGGLRPERATLVYAARARECWPDVPLIIGGIEASLRRFAHYDYWSDKVRRSLLVDAKADLLIYGMGEKQIINIARRLADGQPVRSVTDVPGTCYVARDVSGLDDYVLLPSYEEVSQDKQAFARACRLIFEQQDPYRGKPLVQPHGDRFLIQNRPADPLTTAEMDAVYALPYERTYHPIYESAGGVPALQEVQFSLVSHRGCFGGCAFCAITAHQGRIIQSRSRESILAEARLLTTLPNFKGYIHDVGGPTANFFVPACHLQAQRGACRDRQCLFPQPCANLTVDHSDYLSLLREIRRLPGVKKVFIRSGLRFDYLMADPHSETILREICQYHVSGQLKIAPEHVAAAVTRIMGKSDRGVYEKFMALYQKINRELGKPQFLVPYFIAAHPGCGLKEAVELAEFLRDTGQHPEQVQEFIPTPGSLSTCMYHTGLHPLTGQTVYVATGEHEKRLQRALLQYWEPRNYDLVYEALVRAGRRDLIGRAPSCLIPPRTHRRSAPRVKRPHGGGRPASY